jgi:hypothetical protein
MGGQIFRAGILIEIIGNWAIRPHIPNQNREGTTMKEKEKTEPSRQKITTSDTPYQPPEVESHNPLEIMSRYEDRSSELEF